MMSHTISIAAYGNQGNSVELVDPKACQVFANDTANTVTSVEMQMRDMNKRIDELEAFIRWIGRHHPEVADEYTVSKAAKARIHGTEKV